jgi:hypothetical protein
VRGDEIFSAEIAFDSEKMSNGFDWQNVITHGASGSVALALAITVALVWAARWR